jgi:hypothetical protein
LRISGPRLIRRGDKLKFNATLTNRSDKPAALRFPHSFFDRTQFDWRITNAVGRRHCSANEPAQSTAAERQIEWGEAPARFPQAAT